MGDQRRSVNHECNTVLGKAIHSEFRYSPSAPREKIPYYAIAGNLSFVDAHLESSTAGKLDGSASSKATGGLCSTFPSTTEISFTIASAGM